MSTSPPNGQVIVYFQPVPGGMATMRWNPPTEWLERGHATLTCAECGSDLRPGAEDRSRFNIPDPRTPNRLRLFCGPCAGDGVDEMARLTGRRGEVTGTGRVAGQRLSAQERAAQRRIGGVIRSCGVLSEQGLAMWRESGCGEFKATADEIAVDLGVLGVPHMVVPTDLPPLVSDRSRRIRHGEEVRITTADLPTLVQWIPSLQKHIDKLSTLTAP
ncbi:hypothetical protein IU436_29190 [Nocardia farcinica]|uniref:hypothetical protein n=1 Tax=Nocardia farcinica TaxID=37329 RepID=UPI001893445B|nr:hypothetical protein [Nocardia farcinica]MBF6234836.1 hypothetical protein [Nocardia farcinica]MBF6257216.1 hypothetical protein [Nocardia farcinica]MBF6265541.1 hypothetical protein [Nocardia farcinica]MBF6271288.1 hypothetical protein [Nocardia farcinica]MBF6422747.1 hypothetical protein [Nocardia farcinica]